MTPVADRSADGGAIAATAVIRAASSGLPSTGHARCVAEAFAYSRTSVAEARAAIAHANAGPRHSAVASSSPGPRGYGQMVTASSRSASVATNLNTVSLSRRRSADCSGLVSRSTIATARSSTTGWRTLKCSPRPSTSRAIQITSNGVGRESGSRADVVVRRSSARSAAWTRPSARTPAALLLSTRAIANIQTGGQLSAKACAGLHERMEV